MSATEEMTRRHVGMCPTCGAAQAEDRLGCSIYKARCQSCAVGIVRMAYVTGVKTARSCDARCTSARNRNCQCSCGGRRHGADWVWRGDEPPGRSFASLTNDRPGGSA